MSVACQMEIDLFHRKDLRPSSPCSAAFDPKHRPQRRLPKCDSRSMAETGKAHGKPDGSCCLAFPERGRINGGHEYVPAEGGSMKPLKYVKRNLRLQLSVGKQLAGLNAKLISDILNWTRLH
ncbi:MAG: hypothetical protein EWM73_02675 [Nitrospira sp.]|nr:MAG: hypothetical protein EWM73_02675 [Nitrospira sp.]